MNITNCLHPDQPTHRNVRVHVYLLFFESIYKVIINLLVAKHLNAWHFHIDQAIAKCVLLSFYRALKSNWKLIWIWAEKYRLYMNARLVCENCDFVAANKDAQKKNKKNYYWNSEKSGWVFCFVFSLFHLIAIGFLACIRVARTQIKTFSHLE